MALAVKLTQFVESLQQMISEATPHVLCGYLYELASLFMSFYEACPIMKGYVPEATKVSRLGLTLATKKTLMMGLDILGIEKLERM